MKSTAGMIKELSLEYDIIMQRAAQIKSAILMLQAIPQDAKPKTKVWRAPDSIKGVVLGNIPVKPLSKKVSAKPAKASKKRKYTKKSEFWGKPHPRKKA